MVASASTMVAVADRRSGLQTRMIDHSAVRYSKAVNSTHQCSPLGVSRDGGPETDTLR
jgi:hypothetical protein